MVDAFFLNKPARKKSLCDFLEFGIIISELFKGFITDR